MLDHKRFFFFAIFFTFYRILILIPFIMILDLSIGPTCQMLEWDPVLLLEMDKNVCLESGSARLYEDISNLGGPLG